MAVYTSCDVIMPSMKYLTVAHSPLHRFYLYVKLSVVMGVIWVFEFIPWITGYYRLYGLAGMLNSLHGIYLFFIFVFKRKTLAKLRQRLTCCGRRTVKPTLSKKYSSSTLASISNCALSSAEP